MQRPHPAVLEFGTEALVASRRLDVVANGAQACVVCGCTDNYACVGGCWWVNGPMDDPLCSSCVGDPAQEMAELRHLIEGL
jgi:hypothetical protein